jgi:hypothetical protein
MQKTYPNGFITFKEFHLKQERLTGYIQVIQPFFDTNREITKDKADNVPQ